MDKLFMMKLSNMKKWGIPLWMIGFILTTLFSCTKYDDPAPFYEEYGDDIEVKMQRKVLIVSIDGVIGSEIEKAVPAKMSELIKTSKFTWGSMSEDKTNDATTWTSMMTGVSVSKHMIEDDTYRAKPDPDDPHSIPDFYPSLFYRLMETKPEAETVVITPLNGLANILMIEAGTRIIPENDAAVKDAAVKQLKEENPEIMVVNFRDVLNAGVESGFSIENASYLNAINTTDGYLGEIMTALEGRINYDNEEWLVIVTSNHGGTGDHFGGSSLNERNTFTIFYNKSFLPLELKPSFIEAPDFYQLSTNAYAAPVIEASDAAKYDYDGTEMSIEFRLKRNVKHPWVGQPMILGKTTATSSHRFDDTPTHTGWAIGTQDNHLTFYARMNNGTRVTIPFATSIDNLDWHHFVVTFKLIGTQLIIKLYNDGKFVSESAFNAADIDAAKMQSSAPFFVGVKNSHNASVLSKENLSIAEIRMYDKELNLEEVKENSCIPVLTDKSSNYDKLTGYWRLNVKSGENFNNSIAGKPNLIPKNNHPLLFTMSSLTTPCNVDDVTNVIIRNVDVFSQLFYWLNLEQKSSWGIDGTVFLNQYEVEFIK